MQESGQEVELPSPPLGQAITGQRTGGDMKGYSKESLPESGQCHNATSLHRFPAPASGKDIVMHPYRLKNTKACPGYRPDSQPQFRVNIPALAPPVYNHRYQL